MERRYTHAQRQLMPLLAVMGGQLPVYPAEPRLQQRCAQLEVRAQEANVPVQYAFAMPYRPEPHRYPGDQNDWWLMDIQQDPVYRWDADGYPVPHNVLEQLHRIGRAGLQFDTLCIAHEVEKNRFAPQRPPTLQELLPPPPNAGLQASATMGNFVRSVWTVATLPLLAIGGLAVLGAGAASTFVSLDPILFGVIGRRKDALRPGDAAAFFYLAHWRYNDGSAP